MNPSLEIAGHLITRHDRRLLVHRLYTAKLQEIYGDSVLLTIVPEAVALKVALSCREPAPLHNPKTKGATAIDSLCAELLTRMSQQRVSASRVA